ncbi:class I SAM-dependent methyltransferase [Mycoplasma sp. 1199]|uniref:class I SAM-dependent methyltransferase n=1 Tax=Mycoplasma sp. 1199 TaxID=3108526 RepID=UPI002B1E59CD|nr:class I SAM-dependent methyltransferase [Mycoplasma sp. 1199]MEA4206019.1 class I SAM-dependent methyltransferase [Mycoplasma sp. 1199]
MKNSQTITMSVNELTSVYDTDSSLRHYFEAIENVGILNAEKYWLKNLNIPKTANIADLGTGTGRFIFGALDLGFLNLDGYDISKNSIKKAKEYLTQNYSNKTNINVNFYEVDLSNYKYQKQYDFMIFTFNSLMCIPYRINKINALKNAYTALKPNGYIVFSAHEAKGDINREKLIRQQEKEIKFKNISNWDKGDFVYYQEGQKGVLSYYDFNEIMSLLNEAGIKQIYKYAHRDSLGKETKNALDFSDNAIYYVIKKQS